MEGDGDVIKIPHSVKMANFAVDTTRCDGDLVGTGNKSGRNCAKLRSGNTSERGLQRKDRSSAAPNAVIGTKCAKDMVNAHGGETALDAHISPHVKTKFTNRDMSVRQWR